MHQQGWSLLPDHEFLDEGISGARLDRPALDRLAHDYAHQWFLIEALTKLHIPMIFLQHPCGDTPQGQRLPQLQGMIAEYERAQILERTRRGRLEKARRGAYLPWAYRGYGYRYLPRHNHCRVGRLTSGSIVGELASSQSPIMLTYTHALGGQP
jgi:site-specific DNA recombinase